MVFQESKYPWDRWTSTQAWMVEQYADFYCFGKSFASQVHNYAAKVGMKAATAVFEYEYDRDVVIFQFYDGDSLWKPNLKALPAWKQEHQRHQKARSVTKR